MGIQNPRRPGKGGVSPSPWRRITLSHFAPLLEDNEAARILPPEDLQITYTVRHQRRASVRTNANEYGFAALDRGGLEDHRRGRVFVDRDPPLRNSDIDSGRPFFVLADHG